MRDAISANSGIDLEEAGEQGWDFVERNHIRSITQRALRLRMSLEKNSVRTRSQGRTREHSLHRLATLHRNENMRGLVSLLVQVDRHGGAVQEPLRIYSDRLRESRRSEMKERIGKITVKMTGVMVTTLLPALVIVTAGPGFIAIFRSLGAISK